MQRGLDEMDKREKQMKKHKCLICEKDCPEPFIYETSFLSFSDIWLRICSHECFTDLVFDFIYEIDRHYEFKEWLYKKENKEDSDVKHKLWEEHLDNFKKYLEENPFPKDMLSRPLPKRMKEIFSKKSIFNKKENQDANTKN